MEKLTGDKIISLIREKFCDVTDFIYNNFEVDEFQIGDYEVISEQTGDIDNTSYAHKVFYFKEHDVYIKVNGWYSSYSGCIEWDDAEFSVVEPKEKTITIWE